MVLPDPEPPGASAVGCAVAVLFASGVPLASGAGDPLAAGAGAVPGAVVVTALKVVRNWLSLCPVPLQSSDRVPVPEQALSRPTAQYDSSWMPFCTAKSVSRFASSVVN